MTVQTLTREGGAGLDLPSLRRAASAELLRARSGWRLWGLLFMALWLDSLSIVGNASKKLAALQAGAADSATVSNELVQLGFGALLFATLFGVLQSTTEFRYGSVGRSALSAGGPGRLLAVKAAVGLVVGAVFGLVAAAGAAAAAAITLRVHHFSFVLDRTTVLSIVGVFVVCTLATAWGVLLGWLGRSQVGTLLAVVAWTLLAEPAIFAIVPRVGRFLPGGAQTSIYRDFSSPWTLPTHWGLLLFLGWLALAGAGCAATIRTRDLA